MYDTVEIREAYLSLPIDRLKNLKKELVDMIAQDVRKNEFKNIATITTKIGNIDEELLNRRN